MRLLGREHIRRIKNCQPEQLDAAELRAVCEMAELHRQHVRHNERRKQQIERTAHSKNQYMSIEEAGKVWRILNSRAEIDRKRGLKLSRAIANELIFLLMTEAGLRVQEVCDLTFEGSPVEHEGCYLDFVGKGNKQRIVTTSDELAGRLTEYGKARRHALGGRYRDELPLLANERGRAFKRDAIYRRMKRIGLKAGIMRTRKRKSGTFFSPHKCRHTSALWLLDTCDNMELVKDQLGHTSVDTTSIYARTLAASRKPHVERLHNRLFGNGNGENEQ
ncbi:MAG: tyrosine-type recombinase/integrase [Planctomycetota bacterium]|jgi:site-specific recombinase XerD